MVFILIVVVISGNHNESGSSHKDVKPYHTRTGKFVKGHVRKYVITSRNAVRKQHYSKGYYQRHKSRCTKSKKE
jgi:hypothetical protein